MNEETNNKGKSPPGGMESLEKDRTGAHDNAPLESVTATSDKAEAALREFEESELEKKESGAASLVFLPFRMVRGFFTDFFKIRNEPTIWGKAFMAASCLGLILAVWVYVTRGESEMRIIPRTTIGSPEEVFGSFYTLWFDRALMRNLMASLWRVIKGFGIAALVGIPIGILSGTFKRVEAFFAPISIFGRNVPIVTLVPLSLFWFHGMGERQKVGFIFMACVAFVMFDSARSITDVDGAYLDTAYTLGASKRQVITKVLIPLSMPDIFNSLRLLFGLAFGYIILAEMIGMDVGVGMLISNSEKKGPREHVYLILMFMTVTAFLIDKILFMTQRYLFPYRYGRR